MDRLDLDKGDLDIDLESGETSDEDASRVHDLSSELSRTLLEGKICKIVEVESTSRSTDGRNSSCSSENSQDSDLSADMNNMPSGNFRKNDMVNIGNKMRDMERQKKKKSARPPKPPRPPKGPSLTASDVKLLNEISELNMKRKRMERIRTLRKIKKEKGSSLNSNLFALMVTIIFFVVIISQGLLGSRM